MFEIVEGPTTGVAAINFIGNRIFSDSDLRDQIATTTSAWWKFLTTNDNYDPDRLTFDREPQDMTPADLARNLGVLP